MIENYKSIVDFIKQLYHDQGVISLHAPVFTGNEKKYLTNCIDSTYVSYVGEYVTKFEESICNFTSAKYAVAMSSGTTALQIALIVSGVKTDDEVITQALTFVGTANGIVHSGGTPVFVDVDNDTLGMSPEALEIFLENNCYIDRNENCINNLTKKRIAACVPVHIFGHPCRIDEILSICNKFNIALVEDAAESLGSFYKQQHTGTFGLTGILSFNGNKIVTTGGGGMIITDDKELAKRAKHLTTTAKKPHPYEFFHDEVGYNFRMPNVNAAIGFAQMETIDFFLENKRKTSKLYKEFFNGSEIKFIDEPKNSSSNFWLNSILFRTKEERDIFLEETNRQGIITRPVWTLMNKLPMYRECICGNLDNSNHLADRIVNIPSSVIGVNNK